MSSKRGLSRREQRAAPERECARVARYRARLARSGAVGGTLCHIMRCRKQAISAQRSVIKITRQAQELSRFSLVGCRGDESLSGCESCSHKQIDRRPGSTGVDRCRRCFVDVFGRVARLRLFVLATDNNLARLSLLAAACAEPLQQQQRSSAPLNFATPAPLAGESCVVQSTLRHTPRSPNIPPPAESPVRRSVKD